MNKDLLKFNMLDIPPFSLLDPKGKQSLMDAASEVIMENVLKEAEKNFSPEQKNQFKKIFGSEEEAKQSEFLDKNIPDFEDILIKEIIKYKLALLSFASLAKKNSIALEKI